MNSFKALLFALSCLFVISLTSCDKDDPEETLYERLGGSTMVNDPANPGTKIQQGRLNLRSVVDSTIFIIAGDARLNGFFDVLLAEVTSGNLTGFTALSKNLTDFFSVATGSDDYNYTCLNMVAAHDPAVNNRMDGKSDDDDFDAFIEDVVAGAAQNGVTDADLIGDLGALLETLRADVVQE